jgi:hypothetical protein
MYAASDAARSGENAEPPIALRGRNVTLLERRQWDRMRTTWSAMHEDTRMDIDGSAGRANFVCLDGHNEVVLRCWFTAPSSFSVNIGDLLMQYIARGRENSWLSFCYQREGRLVVLKHVRLYGCYEPVHWRRWEGEWSFDEQDKLLRLEVVVRKFWAWPVERIDLDGWTTQQALVRRLASGEEKVVESCLCTIIAMTEENDDVEYVWMLDCCSKPSARTRQRRRPRRKSLRSFRHRRSTSVALTRCTNGSCRRDLSWRKPRSPL